MNKVDQTDIFHLSAMYSAAVDKAQPQVRLPVCWRITNDLVMIRGGGA